MSSEGSTSTTGSQEARRPGVTSSRRMKYDYKAQCWDKKGGDGVYIGSFLMILAGSFEDDVAIKITALGLGSEA